MTLILTVNGPETIWMLADRRLSRPPPWSPIDNARKFMFLETTDGQAIIGYAGLGATGIGTEPAAWLNATLRDRGFPLEEIILGLAQNVQREFPQHVARLPKGAAAHYFVIPAFLNGNARLYTIDLVFAPDHKTYRFDARWQQGKKPDRTPRFAVAGSGAICLGRDRSWTKELLRLVRASDTGKISPQVVADNLAQINQMVGKRTPDGSVGPQCIVGWRHSKFGVHKDLGGGHQFYDGKQRVPESGVIPSIAVGIDVVAHGQTISRVMGPQLVAQVEAMKRGETPAPLDQTKLEEELAKLPVKPDDKLR